MDTNHNPLGQAVPVPNARALGRPPRRFILRALARTCRTSAASSLSVSPLGTMRWHIRVSEPGDGRKMELYLSPTDGGLVHATEAEGKIDIRLDGALTEGCIRNLGDCLVKALSDGVGHIVLRLGRADVASPEAVSLFDSLGRHLGREGGRRRLEIRGEGQGVRELTEAFGRSHARAALGRRAS